MNGKTGPGVTARCVLESPLGSMIAEATEVGVRTLAFADADCRDAAFADLRSGRAGPVHLQRLSEELGAYFRGEEVIFRVRLDAVGTAFQRSVWDVLVTIPWGERVSYTWVAARLGRPDAVRAVAAANGANPVAIVVPCHRVVGKDGSLVGYGGGLGRKERLLEIEAVATLFRRP